MRYLFLAVSLIYVMSLFLVGASLRSPGMTYLAIFVTMACVSGIVVGRMLLHERD